MAEDDKMNIYACNMFDIDFKIVCQVPSKKIFQQEILYSKTIQFELMMN